MQHLLTVDGNVVGVREVGGFVGLRVGLVVGKSYVVALAFSVEKCRR